MPRNKGQLGLPPTLRERVEVRAAYTAVGDGNLDVLWLKVLRLELYDLEVGPVGWICEASLRRAMNGRCRRDELTRQRVTFELKRVRHCT